MEAHVLTFLPLSNDLKRLYSPSISACVTVAQEAGSCHDVDATSRPFCMDSARETPVKQDKIRTSAIAVLLELLNIVLGQSKAQCLHRYTRLAHAAHWRPQTGTACANSCTFQAYVLQCDVTV